MAIWISGSAGGVALPDMQAGRMLYIPLILIFICDHRRNQRSTSLNRGSAGGVALPDMQAGRMLYIPLAHLHNKNEFRAQAISRS